MDAILAIFELVPKMLNPPVVEPLPLPFVQTGQKVMLLLFGYELFVDDESRNRVGFIIVGTAFDSN